jgi:hypothetical protein
LEEIYKKLVRNSEEIQKKFRRNLNRIKKFRGSLEEIISFQMKFKRFLEEPTSAERLDHAAQYFTEIYCTKVRQFVFEFPSQ